jgi:hypothetical protein
MVDHCTGDWLCRERRLWEMRSALRQPTNHKCRAMPDDDLQRRDIRDCAVGGLLPATERRRER